VLDTSWTAPTMHADGSPLTDLASYNVYYGTTDPPCPGATSVSVASPTAAPGPDQTVAATLTGLTTGPLYFVAVTAVDTGGSESGCSPVASAVPRIDFAVSPTGTVDFGTVNIGSVADQTFTVQNTDGGTVSGTVTTSAPFTVVSGGSFNLVGAGATATVTVRFTPLTAVLTATNVTFTAGGGSISRGVTGTGLVGTNPAPVLTSLSPATATAGGAALTLTVNGSNYVSGSTVQWNGAARTTTFVSATRLTAAIPAADVAATGTASVTVVTPAPGGGTSAAQTFTINNPAPTLTTLSPSSAIVGGAGFTLTLTGNVTIRGTTKSVTFDVQGKRDGASLTATATANPSFKFGDFGMQVPSVFTVLSIVDNINLQLDFVGTAA